MSSLNIRHPPLLAKLSYGCAFFTMFGIVSCIIYAIYLMNRPCLDGYRCEAPPIFFLFLFICGFAGLINFIGLMCGWLAQDLNQPQKFKRHYIQWNAFIFALCLTYVCFVLLMIFLGY